MPLSVGAEGCVRGGVEWILHYQWVLRLEEPVEVVEPYEAQWVVGSELEEELP